VRCPTELELARAVGTDALAGHFAECRGCRDERDRFERAIELAREVPLKLPPPSRREEVRTAVLAQALGSHPMARLALPPKRSRRLLSLGVAIAGVAAAAAAFAFVAWPAGRDPATHLHATITAHPGARYTALSTAPDEVVRLEHGTIDVAVAPLHPGERFRVVVGDAEVEVRGTAFEVVAADDRLVSVEVKHGRVEVRPRDRTHAVLDAGAKWRAADVARAPAPSPPPAPVVAPPAPPPPRPRATPRPRVTPAPPPAPPAPPRARAPEELAYDDAWSAMRARDYARASAAFARVMLLAPDGSLVEDAAFWQAVALARGGRRTQAITAFRDFLDAHPRSPHAGEASAMLGWLLLDTGERAEAARHFRAAIGDPSKSVRASARSGLDALGER
jgi:tetratricopeptide (TPR) repeat protein